jgi:uncharacterized membrane protein
MEEKQQESGLSFERVVFFSDAVFAIVITLLVLEIKPPHLEEHSESGLIAGLLRLIPKFSGFVVSFLIVGAMWIEHHRIFRYIAAYNAGLLWRNLIFLLCISFVPFPTALFSEHYWSRTAFILYAASFAAVALAKLWVWRYAAKKPELLAAGSSEAVLTRISRRSLGVPIACGLAVGLSFLSMMAAPAAFALIPLIARLLDPSKRAQEQDRDDSLPEKAAP